MLREPLARKVDQLADDAESRRQFVGFRQNALAGGDRLGEGIGKRRQRLHFFGGLHIFILADPFHKRLVLQHIVVQHLAGHGFHALTRKARRRLDLVPIIIFGFLRVGLPAPCRTDGNTDKGGGLLKGQRFIAIG